VWTALRQSLRSAASPGRSGLDATIARAVLLPATMKLLGDRNWYLPKRLGWLPKFEHEPQVTPAAA
jgi:hypothetical protein